MHLIMFLYIKGYYNIDLGNRFILYNIIFFVSVYYMKDYHIKFFFLNKGFSLPLEINKFVIFNLFICIGIFGLYFKRTLNLLKVHRYNLESIVIRIIYVSYFVCYVELNNN